MANEALMIPEEQWEMPVSITSDGRWITLREFADQKMVTLSSKSCLNNWRLLDKKRNW